LKGGSKVEGLLDAEGGSKPDRNGERKTIGPITKKAEKSAGETETEERKKHNQALPLLKRRSAKSPCRAGSPSTEKDLGKRGKCGP